MASKTASLFGDYFKTPEQIRKEQQDRLLKQGQMNFTVSQTHKTEGKKTTGNINGYERQLHQCR